MTEKSQDYIRGQQKIEEYLTKDLVRERKIAKCLKIKRTEEMRRTNHIETTRSWKEWEGKEKEGGSSINIAMS